MGSSGQCVAANVSPFAALARHLYDVPDEGKVTVRNDSSVAELFESQRPRLHGAAYRMLGSSSEADDAVQEAWLRLSRSDSSSIDNPGGWLTTVVARVCLDMLRARTNHREQPLDDLPDVPGPSADPEQEAVLADSLGVALLVILETLPPRLASRSSCTICLECRSTQ